MKVLDLNFKNFITVDGASKFLGVSKATVRKWEADGNLSSVKHPINGYRLFREVDLRKLLCKLKVD